MEDFKLFLGRVFIDLFRAFLLAYPIMVFWNLFVPDVFGLPAIKYMQSVYLFVLVDLLFNPWYERKS